MTGIDMQAYRIWECLVCGWTYDEAKGWPDDGIAPGTRWEDIDDDWLCPECGVTKSDFEMVETGLAAEKIEVATPKEQQVVAIDSNQQVYQVSECLVCGWIYDEVKGWPEDGIAPGTRWQDIAKDWICPECGVGKGDFEMVSVSRSIVAVAAAPEAAVSIDYSKPPLVIIGTGLAGYNLAKEFRRLDQTTPLLMITSDDGCYYSKPLISTGYHKAKSADQMASASAEKMAAQLHTEIRIFTEVNAINTTQRSLQLGEEVLTYGQLVLATGGRCIEPPLQGNASNSAHSINNLLDYAKFRTAMVGKKKVLIIGAGLIGAEYTNDLIQSGFEVVAVDPLDSVLGTLLPKTASESLQNALQAHGAKFHFGTVVKQLDHEGNGLRAQLGNGETIDADIVLSAVGVRPNLTLAELSGLTTNRGIVTDQFLQTSAEHVYALGDAAEVEGHVLLYVAPLMECARKLAQTLSGTPTAVHYGAMPVTVKTTLFPVVVSPPPKQQTGNWEIEVDSSSGVKALFRNAEGDLLGFALTGDCISARELLVSQVRPIMAD
jgi:rubredoxin-NAD+ reductase